MIRTLFVSLGLGALASSAWGQSTAPAEVTLPADPAAMPVPALIPLQDFFRNPEMTGFSLSPDGSHLAWLAPVEGRMNLFVRKIVNDAGQLQPFANLMEGATPITTVKDRDIPGFGWASNRRLVYMMDSGGDENFHLWAVDLDGKNLKDLTPFPGVRAELIDSLRNDDDHMIVGLNHRNPELHDAYRVNVNSGELTLLVENPGLYSGYVTDHAGVIRVATATDGVETALFYRANNKSAFEEILRTDFRESVSPQGFSFDNMELYALSNLGRDKQALVILDPASGKELEEIYAHPEVDLDGAIFSEERELLTGVAYTTDKRHYHWFDPQRAKLQQTIDRQLPGLEGRIASTNRAETIFLVRSFSDRDLGAYYLLDTRVIEGQAPAMVKFLDAAPWLDPEQMAAMTPVKFPSRDGLTLHGYLTLPAGVEAKNLPLIVNPHGGPWVRDDWGFSPEVQFLANRGYAVLQVNYRGSTGYGRQFWEAGFRQWGRSMQDDLSDGVKWAIAEGIADPARVGIYGASYGGYATLAGLAYSPELYACGVDYVGVSNLLTFMNSLPPYWEQGRQMLYTMVGNPEDPQQREEMAAASPALNAEKIVDPLLVAQGANDPRVVKPESDQMVAALRARGVEVPYLVKDNEGHGFHNEENQFEFYRAMEQFLAAHLGGRQEEHADVLQALLATPTDDALAAGAAGAPAESTESTAANETTAASLESAAGSSASMAAGASLSSAQAEAQAEDQAAAQTPTPSGEQPVALPQPAAATDQPPTAAQEAAAEDAELTPATPPVATPQT